jgi:hypothetical protein
MFAAASVTLVPTTYSTSPLHLASVQTRFYAATQSDVTTTCYPHICNCTRAKALSSGWERLEAALDYELEDLKMTGHDAVPKINFRTLEMGEIQFGDVEYIRKAGVVVVENVVPQELVRAWKRDAQAYAAVNPDHAGFPPTHTGHEVLELYWSKAQLEARQHPHVHDTLKHLNKLLWSEDHYHNTDPVRAANAANADNEHNPPDPGKVDLATVYTYGERLHIKPPTRGQPPNLQTFSLGVHIDGGSIERFEDPNYRKLYASIFSGDWESYDPWNAEGRVGVNTSMYNNEPNGVASVFRTFQGWLAVSDIGPVPNAGTLKVLPLLKLTTAYLLLRPFLEDVPHRDFCGAVPGKGQDLMKKWHAKLMDAMVTIPPIQAGTMVFWHPDVIHAVEKVNNGRTDSAVFYIPSLPKCEVNEAYVRRQLVQFLQGKTPPDFPPNHSEVDFQSRGRLADLTNLGREMMGLPRDPELEPPVVDKTTKDEL